MSSKVANIVEELKTLSLLEASELVKQIEEVFGVSAAAPAGGVVVQRLQLLLLKKLKNKPNLRLS